jgi:hypothetical protein
MKRVTMAIALVSVITGTVFAGDIPSVPAPPPAAPQSTKGGDMGGGGFAEAMTDELVLAIFGIFAG